MNCTLYIFSIRIDYNIRNSSKTYNMHACIKLSNMMAAADAFVPA